MVWNFSKQMVRHDRFFEDSATELARPNRLRSLAPRNFQNSMIAYSKMLHWNERFVEAMARGIPRLLDNHDPRWPKTDKRVLFSYTCRDGSEVPADAFRISGLTVIARSFHDLRATGRSVELMFASMWDYVRRSLERSPPMMREPGDACAFAAQLLRVKADGLLRAEAAEPLVDAVLAAASELCRDAPQRQVDQFRQALRRAGLPDGG